MVGMNVNSERHSNSRISQSDIERSLLEIGIVPGDTLLLRAGLKAVGRIDGGGRTFLDALLKILGPSGTLISLAFTGSSFIVKPQKEDAFDIRKKSNSGALPNLMIDHPLARRSLHPTCSFVAIGKNADYILTGHDQNSPAYEPVRKIIELDGKCMLIGCVDSSPGFTTTHLAEADLGMTALSLFSGLYSTYYKSSDGGLRLFRRPDPGFCSLSYYKFYSFYVKKGILRTGVVGNAYSILALAKKCYEVEFEVLSKDSKFNLCDSLDCYTCNAGRRDRICFLPLFLLRKIWNKIRAICANRRK